MNPSVCVTRCPSYQPIDLLPAIDRTLDALGGIGRFVQPGDRVLLKPNCIARLPPESAGQTHPAVIVEVARRVIAVGGIPVVGDSPAWGRLSGNLAALGALEPLADLGVQVVEFTRSRWIANYPMRVYRGFRVAREVLAVDKIINLPKLKAHKQLGLTAAIKNMFGCVAGKRKAWWHFSAGDKRNLFGWLLVELFDRLRPCLTIVDGVLGQQGDGPIHGQPRGFHWLVAGVDGVAIERVCAELVGMAPAELRILRAAEELGIGQPDLAGIEVVGETISSQRINDFARPDMMPIRFPLFRVLRSTVKNLFLRSRRG